MNDFSYFPAGSIVESQPEPKENLTLAEYIERVKSGVFQAYTEHVRAQEYGSDEYKTAKKVLPFITPHGTFKRKHNDGINARSGIFCLDVDPKDNPGIDFSQFANDLKNNPAVAAFHKSPGMGLSIFVSVAIDAATWENHTAEYKYIFDHFTKVYGVKFDWLQKALSQARYCCHDDNPYYNAAAKPQKIILPKAEPKEAVIYTGENAATIESILSYLEETNTGITPDYQTWLNVGFALIRELGERSGREAFHRVSQLEPHLYDFDSAEDCISGVIKSINAGTPGKPVTVATLISLAKAAGWKATVNAETEEETEGQDATKKGEIIELFHLYISEMEIRYNIITRLVDLKTVQMEDRHYNSLWMDCHINKGINISKQDVFAIINSDAIPVYNPLIEILETLPTQGPKAESLIYKLACSIDQDTYPMDLFWELLKKWLVGTVAGVYPTHKNILQLVLSGGQNTGKTEFFRRLLPPVLHGYYAENKLDDGKDSEILMCQKLMIMDDEFGGKSKFEVKRLKELSSKTEVTTRLPYAKAPVTMDRIATLCGTTNEPEILADTTGNRRIIPVNVIGRNFEAYDSINKVKLWGEVMALYKEGYNYELTKKNISDMEPRTHEFTRVLDEEALIQKYYHVPNGGQAVEMTPTDIKIFLRENSGLNTLSTVNIGRALRKLGYEQKLKKIDGKTGRIWLMSPTFA